MADKKNVRKQHSFLWRAHCEGIVPSSKRLYGGIMVITAQICLLVAFIMDGPSEIVKDLCEVDIITGASLLGLNNITSIWKSGQVSIGEDAPKAKKEMSEEDFEA